MGGNDKTKGVHEPRQGRANTESRDEMDTTPSRRRRCRKETKDSTPEGVETMGGSTTKEGGCEETRPKDQGKKSGDEVLKGIPKTYQSRVCPKRNTKIFRLQGFIRGSARGWQMPVARKHSNDHAQLCFPGWRLWFEVNGVAVGTCDGRGCGVWSPESARESALQQHHAHLR